MVLSLARSGMEDDVEEPSSDKEAGSTSHEQFKKRQNPTDPLREAQGGFHPSQGPPGGLGRGQLPCHHQAPHPQPPQSGVRGYREA